MSTKLTSLSAMENLPLRVGTWPALWYMAFDAGDVQEKRSRVACRFVSWDDTVETENAYRLWRAFDKLSSERDFSQRVMAVNDTH